MKRFLWSLTATFVCFGLVATTRGQATRTGPRAAESHEKEIIKGNDKNDHGEGQEENDTAPNGKGTGGDQKGPARIQAPTSNGINYHGGPVMLGAANVYYIWYGAWTGNSALTLLPSFAGAIGGSPYFNINTTYYNAAGTHVTNAVTYRGSANDNYSQGKSLSDAGVQAVVANAISTNALPKDTNGVYFVLTSSDVNETSGFCTQYCGWHSYGSIAGSNIKFAFVGNPDRCPSACEEQTTSPNGNAGADGMANIIGHELEESVTDPNLNAWYDKRGNENADKCAWTFGTTSTAANGSKYNMTLSDGKPYLIQQNWVNASGGYCGQKF
jgi:hypothetical protein